MAVPTRRLLTVVVASLVGVLLAACSGDADSPDPNAAGGDSMESAMPTEAAATDTSEPAEPEEADDPAMTADVPGNWPSDLPVPGGTIFSSAEGDGEATIQSNIGGKEDADAYLQEMVDAGWVIGAEFPADTGGTWTLEKGTTSVTYLVSSTDGTYRVAVGVNFG